MEEPEIKRERLIRIDELIDRTGLAESTIWSLVKNSKEPNGKPFPIPRKLSPRITVWVESELDKYIDKIIEYRSYD